MNSGEKKESIKEPTTAEETLALHQILRSDPQRYLRIVNEWIKENPANIHAYFDRHSAWMRLGEPRLALEDLNTVIDLAREPDPISLFSRGLVYRHLGQYQKALEDFDRGEAIEPKQWEEDVVFGLLYQADPHARLGNEASRASLLLAPAGRLLDSRHLWRSWRRQSGHCRQAAPHCGRRSSGDSDADQSCMKWMILWMP